MSKNSTPGIAAGFDPIRTFGVRYRKNSKRTNSVVGLIGLEPMTLRLSSACSNQLSYRPEGKCSVASIQYSGLKTEN